ncbi:beta-1,6-N-acetylglucosaminyltransferase [Sedimentimonas flavescens]|uniref:beta-1,6-N-acetylglucosaminyltransferase n=1 Tax=Sedimentimonas flavescens TaxID=2851012 RepID=UPI0021A29A83|nr:beta-1,6-N-acetylglucosaminyltransferase [Sedimentimonas flavescens]MCT2540500.1 beta-1,6-N-acetylglucosaminyltransferase [Sedimentimonas flavescens]
MAKIAFILLTHKDPEGVISQARRLSSEGDFVSIHFDARASQADFARIQTALADDPAITFARRRVKCGWGEWSLVAATLEALKAAVDAFPQATHFYMISGDCLPIKTAEYVHDFLDAEDVDYIESVDFFTSGWIKTGMREDRLIYRHVFNERQSKWLFYKTYEIQRALGMTRKVPEDLQMMIGSQWWCLRRQTVEAVLEFCRARPAVMRFFKTTWIPDETFFQTLVRHLVPDREIRSRTPTFLMFTDYGMPVTFYNDHYDLLLGQDFLFARKISPDAADLKTRLGALWHETARAFSISGEGRALYSFLTGRGRIGRRFVPRFWEVESSLGRERTLYVVVCKKWHVAKRLVEQAGARAGIPRVEYLFNELCPLPALGGIETTLSKRNRHRRALLRMLFDYHRTDRLLICVDPAEFELLRDLSADRVDARILEIECDFTDDYLIGHARRVGLAGEQSPAGVIARLLPTIRFDLKFESDRMRDAGFPAFEHIRQGATPRENALPIARFLGVDRDLAHEIAATEYLFLD